MTILKAPGWIRITVGLVGVAGLVLSAVCFLAADVIFGADAFRPLARVPIGLLPNPDTAANDLGVFNIAGALPFSIAPAPAPTILAIGGVLYAFAGACAIIGAAAVLPVKRVR